TSVVTVRDAGGTSQGAFDASHVGPAIDAARLVPPSLRAALRGCSEVEVLARPPVQGLPQLLADDVAWSYRVDRDRRPTAPGSAPARATRLVIANTEPPASLGVPRLLPWQSSEAPDVRLEGAAATPSRALAEFTDATFIEVHSHGVADTTGADAAFLMLSPEPDGRYALTAAEIRQHPLRGRPIVILAACHAATTATYRHEAWSLPAAFVAAGARAVIASTDVIDDAAAGAFFDDMRARIEHGASPAVALRDVRVTWLASHPGATWVHSLMVFE
ncbi:MAG TPA: CHAT domain-containing protein, partial [Kofleriaceae bacterium]